MTIRETAVYRKWFMKLRDMTTRARILVRLRRLSLGHWGDWKDLGDGLMELRLSFGSGYRIYLTQRGEELIILLAGGDKSTQEHDIKKARKLAEYL